MLEKEKNHNKIDKVDIILSTPVSFGFISLSWIFEHLWFTIVSAIFLLIITYLSYLRIKLTIPFWKSFNQEYKVVRQAETGVILPGIFFSLSIIFLLLAIFISSAFYLLAFTFMLSYGFLFPIRLITYMIKYIIVNNRIIIFRSTPQKHEKLIYLLFTSNEHISRAVKKNISNLGSKMIPLLSKVYYDNYPKDFYCWHVDKPKFLANIIELIGNIGDEDALMMLKKELINYSMWKEVRNVIIDAIDNINSLQKESIFINALGDKNEYVVSKALKSLIKLGTPRSKFYVSLYNGNVHSAIRDSVQENAIYYASEAFNNHRSIQIRKNAIKVLVEIGGIETESYLLKALNDNSKDVKLSALEEISKRSYPKTENCLISSLADYQIAEKALEALLKVGTPRSKFYFYLYQGDIDSAISGLTYKPRG